MIQLKKKIVCCFATIVALTCASNVYADKNEIAPYEAAVTELNEELGSHIQIPSEENMLSVGLDKNEVFKNITSKSVLEFKEDLRKEYLEISPAIDQNGAYIMSLESIESIESNSNARVDTSITQRAYLDYGSVYLTSRTTVGSSQHFYAQITSYGYRTYTDRTHFRSRTSSHYLTNSNKNCVVSHTGSLYSKDGVQLSVNKSYRLTYTAGGGDIYQWT